MSDQIGPGPGGRVAYLMAEPDDHLYRVHARTAGVLAEGVAEADARRLVYGSPWGGLDDETAGRRWCRANGKRPEDNPHRTRLPYAWGSADWYDESDVIGLPPLLFDALAKAGGHPRRMFATEAAVYAAVGAALRVLAAVLDGEGGVT